MKSIHKQFQTWLQELIDEEVMKVRKQLCEMMPCGHPAAALNRQDQKDDGREHTMYCRSCSLDGQKEKLQ